MIEFVDWRDHKKTRTNLRGDEPEFYDQIHDLQVTNDERLRWLWSANWSSAFNPMQHFLFVDR